jgi:hypothetical protein
MAKQRKRVKHTATFEERLGEERLDSPSLAIPGLTSSDRKPNLPLPWARMGLNAKCSTG